MISTTKATAPIPGKSYTSSVGQGVLRISRLTSDDNVDEPSSLTRTNIMEHSHEHYARNFVDLQNVEMPPLETSIEESQASANMQNNTSKDWTTVKRQENNTRKRNKRKLRQHLKLEDIFKNEDHYESHYIITFPGLNISNDLDIIKTSKELKESAGKLKKITRAGKSTLLVETVSALQSEKLKKIKKLANHEVLVTKHKLFNSVKGVVRSRAFGHNTIEEIRENLSNQGVSDVRRVSIRRNNEIIQTDTYILTFELNKLPPIIIYGEFHREIVEEYKHKPQQCYKCQKFGHVAKYCRSEADTCSRCGLQGHVQHDCRNAIKCYHCNKDHYSNSKDCDKYKCEEQILSIQMKEKIPRGDAVEITMSHNPQYERLYENNTRQRASRLPPTAAAVTSGKTSTSLQDHQSNEPSYTLPTTSSHTKQDTTNSKPESNVINTLIKTYQNTTDKKMDTEDCNMKRTRESINSRNTFSSINKPNSTIAQSNTKSNEKSQTDKQTDNTKTSGTKPKSQPESIPIKRKKRIGIDYSSSEGDSHSSADEAKRKRHPEGRVSSRNKNEDKTINYKSIPVIGSMIASSSYKHSRDKEAKHNTKNDKMINK